MSLGKKLFKLEEQARNLKSALNELKIVLGIVLNEIEDIYSEECFDGNPDFDEDDVTFNQFLASIWLNTRRVIQMKRNANYILELGIDPELYKELDSSLIELCKKNKVNPLDYIYNSYADACQTIKEEKGNGISNDISTGS